MPDRHIAHNGPVERREHSREDARRYLKQRRRRRHLGDLSVPLICLLFLIGAFGLNIASAQVPSGARAERAVEALGMTNAHVTHRGLAWGVLGGCKSDDVTKFTVKAIDPRGHARTIEVCAPILGGYTIRG